MNRTTANNRTTEEARKSIEEIISEKLGTLSLEEQAIQKQLAHKAEIKREKAKEAQRRFREKNILVEGKKVKPSFEELLPSTIANLSALKSTKIEESLYLSDVPATIGYDEVEPLAFLTKMAEVFSSIYLSLPESLRPIIKVIEVNAGEEILYSNIMQVVSDIERTCKLAQNKYKDLLVYINKLCMKALITKYSKKDKELVLRKLDSSKRIYIEATAYIESCKQLRTLFAEFNKLCNADGYENLREFVALSLAKVQEAKDYKANLGL